MKKTIFYDGGNWVSAKDYRAAEIEVERLNRRVEKLEAGRTWKIGSLLTLRRKLRDYRDHDEELRAINRSLARKLVLAIAALEYYESEYEYGIKAKEAIEKIKEIK